MKNDEKSCTVQNFAAQLPLQTNDISQSGDRSLVAWYLSKQSKEAKKASLCFRARNGLITRQMIKTGVREGKGKYLFLHPSFGSGNKRVLDIFSELFFINGSYQPCYYYMWVSLQINHWHLSKEWEPHLFHQNALSQERLVRPPFL